MKIYEQPEEELITDNEWEDEEEDKDWLNDEDDEDDDDDFDYYAEEDAMEKYFNEKYGE